jgi:hypothetical protein
MAPEFHRLLAYPIAVSEPLDYIITCSTAFFCRKCSPLAEQVTQISVTKSKRKTSIIKSTKIYDLP